MAVLHLPANAQTIDEALWRDYGLKVLQLKSLMTYGPNQAIFRDQQDRIVAVPRVCRDAYFRYYDKDELLHGIIVNGLTLRQIIQNYPVVSNPRYTERGLREIFKFPLSEIMHLSEEIQNEWADRAKVDYKVNQLTSP